MGYLENRRKGYEALVLGALVAAEWVTNGVRAAAGKPPVQWFDDDPPPSPGGGDE